MAVSSPEILGAQLSYILASQAGSSSPTGHDGCFLTLISHYRKGNIYPGKQPAASSLLSKCPSRRVRFLIVPSSDEVIGPGPTWNPHEDSRSGKWPVEAVLICRSPGKISAYVTSSGDGYNNCIHIPDQEPFRQLGLYTVVITPECLCSEICKTMHFRGFQDRFQQAVVKAQSIQYYCCVSRQTFLSVGNMCLSAVGCRHLTSLIGDDKTQGQA